jgi:phosphatidylinositol-3-phosphatase
MGFLLVLVAACSSGTGDPAGAGGTVGDGTARATGPLPRPDHVVVAIFENKSEQSVLGSPQAAYLTQLAGTGARFTDAHGVRHPSQPNYLALFSGSTQDVTNDQCPLTFSGGNLAAQLAAAGHTFVGYSEGLPQPGFTGCKVGGYARKHNPWVDFPALPASVNQPLSAMPSDYGRLPTVAFVVPDLCNDMHDCPVATGDAWARQVLDPYARWARTHNSLLIVTFDESEGGSAVNHIATFVVGAGVTTTSVAQRIDHYSVLRTLEDMYGLPPLGEAANAQPLAGIWAG